MSTSYYWRFEPEVPREVRTVWGGVIRVTIDWDDPQLHIGKATSKNFLWASEAGKTKAYCQAHLDDVVAVNEYETEVTGRELLGVLDGLQEDHTSVGCRFS